MIFSCICLSPDVENLLKKIPTLCPGSDDDLCHLITGYGAVYRMCFSLAIFFFVFSLFTIKVQTSSDFRARIHNGFWFFKILSIIGLMVGAFSIRDPQFLYIWRIFGLIGALIFTFVQLILLVDFAHSWHERWNAAYEETGNRIYPSGIISFTVLFYSVAIAAIVCFYIYFASGPTCHFGKILVSINLFVCVIFSAISILPSVQEKLLTSGLFQSSWISAYIMYLTWSALVNIPDVSCNPTLRTINTTTTDENGKTIEVVSADLNFGWQTCISLIILLCSVVYSCIRNSTHDKVGRLTISGNIDSTNAAGSGRFSTAAFEQGVQTVWDNEKDGVAYSYAMFHFMMFLATHFVMMSITNWYSPDTRTGILSANHASFWIKAVSSWFCALLYIWTLVAPVLFPDRDFT
nr:serine incorporator 1 [Hymenolepis microstoma]